MEYMSTEIRSAREAMTIFKILGIKDVTTDRQRKNGTQVFELPIQQMWQTLDPKPIRFATYKTGYVRNISESNSSCYQINKTKKRPAGTDGYHYETGIVFQYDITTDKELGADDFEKLLVDQGHRLKDCEWMSHADETINKVKIEL